MAERHAQVYIVKPERGDIFAYTGDNGAGGVPGQVVDTWKVKRGLRGLLERNPDYIVTLQYEPPIKYGKQVVRHLDFYASELRKITS